MASSNTITTHVHNSTPLTATVQTLDDFQKYEIFPQKNLKLSLPQTTPEGEKSLSEVEFILKIYSLNGKVLKSLKVPLKRYSRWVINLNGIGERMLKSQYDVKDKNCFFKWEMDFYYNFTIANHSQLQPSNGGLVARNSSLLPVIGIPFAKNPFESYIKYQFSGEEWINVSREMLQGFSEKPDEFANAFSTAENCYKVLECFCQWASDLDTSDDWNSDAVAFQVWNQVMLIYEKMIEIKTLKNFTVDENRIKEAEKELVEKMTHRLQLSTTYLENAVEVASCIRELNRTLIELMVDKVIMDFPKTEISRAVIMYIFQIGNSEEDPPRPPVYNKDNAEDKKLFQDVCNKILATEISDQGLEMRHRGQLLSILNASIVKEVDMSKLNEFIAAIIKTQGRRGLVVDANASEENTFYDHEKSNLAVLAIAAFEQGIYSKKEMMPPECLLFISDYAEKNQSGTMPTYVLDILDKSSNAPNTSSAIAHASFQVTKKSKPLSNTEPKTHKKMRDTDKNNKPGTSKRLSPSLQWLHLSKHAKTFWCPKCDNYYSKLKGKCPNPNCGQ